ncbi:MAG: hypothetical protein ABSC23_15570 [Bryobacteraceae bacterium]|jgi:uncharacterized protein (TIGR03437 family)
MKRILVLLFGAAAVFAADFTNGQAARLVIGQTTFTDEDPNSSDIVLGAPSGIAYAADTLFVADANRVGATPSNHRVLLFQNLSSQLPGPTDQLAQGRKCPVCLGRATLVLGQPDFTANTLSLAATSSSLRLPTAVASDGVRLVVADTDHNRVLIWNHIPASNDAPADVVIGQPDFTSTGTPANFVPTPSSLIGPQGVWIQNGKLYIADTQANRVLIYNRIPTANGAAADVVLGQPSFTTPVQVDISQQNLTASAANMLSPVSVTSDGQRLYVADLGFNRVLVWNAIPTANDAPADVAIGQPDLVSSVANNSFTQDSTTLVETPVMCKTSNGVDSNGNPTYPALCSSTLNFPRFALAAGNRLFVADGGNDRVLIFDKIPAASGASADVILGQLGGEVYQAADAADSMRAPMSLAWDGANLYVSDAYDRRIMVYSAGENSIPYSGIRNGASFEVFATSSITINGSIHAGDTITVAIADNSTDLNTTSTTSCVAPVCAEYTYTVQAADTLTTVVDALVGVINTSNGGAGDPNVVASSNPTAHIVLLTARAEGEPGNSVAFSTETSYGSLISATSGSGGTLSGGANTAQLAPGTLVTIFPNNATGSVTLSGAINAGDIVTVAIAPNSSSPGASYAYTVQSTDRLGSVLAGLANAINGANGGAGDPYVTVVANSSISALLLTARTSGPAGNSIAFSAAASSGAHIAASASGSILSGGSVLSYATATADLTQDALPLQLAGTQVYFNGIRAPLLYVSPTQINTQIPWEVNGSTSISAYVRTTKADGSVVATTPVAVTVVAANPGIFTYGNGGSLPVAVAVHASSHATIVVSVDGGIAGGDVAQIVIVSRTYSYVVQEGDTVVTVRDALSAQINANDPLVTAINSAQFSRIILEAKVAGPAGEGIPVTADVAPLGSAGVGGALVMTVLDNQSTCCSNVAGALVTPDNPAVAGELIQIYATGMGLPVGYDPTSAGPASAIYKTGIRFPANSPATTPQSTVSSLAGGSTANLLGATPKAGMFGVFEVLLQLSTALASDPSTQLYIAQDVFISNTVTLPVVSPFPPGSQ